MKERTKLTKFYYKNGQRKEDQEKLEAKTIYCTEQILKAKDGYALKTTNKLNNPKIGPKTYWSILKYFFIKQKNSNHSSFTY